MKTSMTLCLFLTACCLFPACSTASLSTAGAQVAPTRDALPPACETLGLVTGQGGGTFGGAYLSNDDLIDYAMNDLRNKAAELGASHVRHDPPQLGSGEGTTTTVTMTGTAYRCPDDMPRSM